MTNMREYIETLVRPTDVLVIDSEEKTSNEIKSALASHNCRVVVIPNSADYRRSLQGAIPDLVFLADDISGNVDSMAVVNLIERDYPMASVVILTRTPSSPQIAALMKRGPYTFLVKNGSFTMSHIRRVFCQLNLRLRDGGIPAVDENETCPQPV